MKFNTNFHFVDYSCLGYGKRVGLFFKDKPSLIATNPRGEIGKFGIHAHSSRSRFFHRTIPITAQEFNTNKTRIIYLKRSSTIRWLNAQLNDNEQIHSQNNHKLN